MANDIDRRGFLRTAGVTVGVAGVARSAEARRGPDRGDDVFVLFDSVTGDGTRYTAAVCHDRQADQTAGVVVPTRDQGDRSTADPFFGVRNPGVRPIREDVLADLDIHRLVSSVRRTRRHRGWIYGTVDSPGARSRRRSDAAGTPGLWDRLLEASDRALTRTGGTVRRTGGASDRAVRATVGQSSTRSLPQRAVRDLTNGTQQSLRRFGVYYSKHPQRSRCLATVSNSSHGQLGVSIDYRETLEMVGPSVLGAALGGIVGAIVGGRATGALSGVLGLVAGGAASSLPRSSDITLGLRDRDACTLGLCTPGLRLLTSGDWLARKRELGRAEGVRDVPGVHLGDGLRVPTGYSEVVDHR